MDRLLDIGQEISLDGGFLIARPAVNDTDQPFLRTVTGVSNRFKSSAAWMAGGGTKHPFTLLVDPAETDRKADI
jgi:hypothetical protein